MKNQILLQKIFFFASLIAFTAFIAYNIVMNGALVACI
jgi:hypothetical protein